MANIFPCAREMMIYGFDDGAVIQGTFPDVSEQILDITGGKVPLVVTDPPYGGIVDEAWDQGISAACIGRWAKRCVDLLIPGGSLYFWGGIGKRGNRPFMEFLSSFEETHGARIADIITWQKRRAYGCADRYLFVREECAWIVNGDKPRTFRIPLLEKERGYEGFNAKYPAKSKFLRRGNVWTDVPELFRGKLHPTQKPERLFEIPVETHTEPGEWIVDPFAGSGTAGVAARKLGRKFVLVEQDPKHVATILDRLATAGTHAR